MGRKKKTQGETRSVSAYLPVEIYEKIDAWAKRETLRRQTQVSMSDFLVLAAREKLERIAPSVAHRPKPPPGKPISYEEGFNALLPGGGE